MRRVQDYLYPLKKAFAAGHEVGISQKQRYAIFHDIESICSLHEGQILSPLARRLQHESWSPGAPQLLPPSRLVRILVQTRRKGIADVLCLA